ncbi:MAG TPA: hypothetical protein VFR18_09270 [Terriglobia bacterium]|nr:hypothetical protein [Terriglobia bacterium]
MQQLDDRSSLDLLSAISQRSTKGDAIRQAIAVHEDTLIRVLESSKQNAVITSISLILYGLDSTKAKEANAALYARRQAFKTRVASDRRTRESTPQTLSQINASIVRSQDPVEELRPESALSLFIDNDSLFISVHRAENDDALLQIWRKTGDKYEFLNRVETEGGIQKLKDWETFEFGPDTFFRVPVDIPGSGNFKEEHIFHIELRQRSVQEVRIDRPALSLLPGEYVRKEGGYNFRDNGISYFFYIWTKDGIDEASVDYKIERDNDGTWAMKPGEVKRTPQPN